MAFLKPYIQSCIQNSITRNEPSFFKQNVCHVVFSTEVVFVFITCHVLRNFICFQTFSLPTACWK